MITVTLPIKNGNNYWQDNTINKQLKEDMLGWHLDIWGEIKPHWSYHFNMQNMSCLEVGGCFAPREQESANVNGRNDEKSEPA